MLIVNADDYGCDRTATDQTLRAFAGGRVTSATAMVFMADSDRAAALAREAGLPTGLHLNLTDPLTDPATPLEVRRRHLRASRHFSFCLRRRRAWLPSTAVRRDVAGAIADQVERFQRTFGCAPTHVDGHNHIHFCPDVIAAPALRPHRKRRNVLWSYPSARSAPALARAARRELSYRGLLTTRYFFDIAEVLAADSALSADEDSVEVMAHPGFAHELALLDSPRWGEAVAARRTGSFAELGEERR